MEMNFHNCLQKLNENQITQKDFLTNVEYSLYKTIERII